MIWLLVGALFWIGIAALILAFIRIAKIADEAIERARERDRLF